MAGLDGVDIDLELGAQVDLALRAGLQPAQRLLGRRIRRTGRHPDVAVERDAGATGRNAPHALFGLRLRRIVRDQVEVVVHAAAIGQRSDMGLAGRAGGGEIDQGRGARSLCAERHLHQLVARIPADFDAQGFDQLRARGERLQASVAQQCA